MNSWEILEQGHDGYDDYDRMPEDYVHERYGRRMGMRGDEAEQAYKEGCRHGYEKAMKKVKEMLHGSMDERTEYGDWSGENRPDDWREPSAPMARAMMTGGMGERRRRSNGRYY